MTLEEAYKIVEDYEYWEDVSCSCHLNPPCSKCVECPTEEDYLEAVEVIIMEELD